MCLIPFSPAQCRNYFKKLRLSLRSVLILTAFLRQQVCGDSLVASQSPVAIRSEGAPPPTKASVAISIGFRRAPVRKQKMSEGKAYQAAESEILQQRLRKL
jgi:hypothetical protein